MRKLVVMGIAVLVILSMVPVMVAAVPPSTITVTVNVKSSTGANLAGAKVFYKLGSTYNFGTTGGSGSVSKTFPAGTTDLEVWVVYQGTTSAHKTQAISSPGGNIFNFQTRLVTHRFRTSSLAPIPGGKIRYGVGSTYTTWWWPGGLTGADGKTSAELFPGTYSYELQYKGTTTQQLTIELPVTDPVQNIDWWTIPVTIRLKTCGGAPLDGGMVRYGKGSTYTTWWFPGGPTGSGSNPDGETEADLLGGSTYSFEMQYGGTVEQELDVDLPSSPGAEFISLQTTAVTLDYPGAISYGGPSGQSRWFTKPTMQLLPGGPYRFHFQNPEGGRLWLSWSGCSFSGDVRVVNLIQKDPNPPWNPVPGGDSGQVTLVRGGGPFEMTGKGLPLSTDYSLIYYPDPWPGYGLKVIGTGTSGTDGKIAINGVFAFSTIPYPALPATPGDGNSPNAKIWLVPTDAIQYSDDGDWSNDYMTTYDVALFEVNLLGP